MADKNAENEFDCSKMKKLNEYKQELVEMLNNINPDTEEIEEIQSPSLFSNFASNIYDALGNKSFKLQINSPSYKNSNQLKNPAVRKKMLGSQPQIIRKFSHNVLARQSSQLKSFIALKSKNENEEEIKSNHEFKINPRFLDNRKMTCIESTLMKYRPRKLKLLVANDNQFQLLIVRTALLKLPYIEHIDEANNG